MKRATSQANNLLNQLMAMAESTKLDSTLQLFADCIQHNTVDKNGNPLFFDNVLFLLKQSEFASAFKSVLAYRSFVNRNGKQISAREHSLPVVKDMIRLIADSKGISVTDEWIDRQVEKYDESVFKSLN